MFVTRKTDNTTEESKTFMLDKLVNVDSEAKQKQKESNEEYKDEACE